ncbi:MAG: hypothetical protein VX668_08365, partial [Planctomycetota bacterium]|nr:hypothetical protein [Planctomycetota bacterium]
LDALYHRTWWSSHDPASEASFEPPTKITYGFLQDCILLVVVPSNDRLARRPSIDAIRVGETDLCFDE